MTGPGAVMPQAPSLPSQSTVKAANFAKAVEGETAELTGFAELFQALKGETDAPSDPEQEVGAQQDESTGQMPLPFPMLMLPEKTPQTRFAEELSVTLPPGFAQGSLTALPPAPGAEPPETVEPAKGRPLLITTVVGTFPVPPPEADPVAATMSSGPPNAPPATPPVLGSTVPAIPLKAPQDVARTVPQDGAVAGEGAAASTGLLAPSSQAALSGDRSAQDGEQGSKEHTLAVLKEAKASVVSQETHFAPVPQLSPALQLANRIAQEVEITDPVFTTGAAAAANDASAAPVKVLSIKLDPPELGALTIRMSLKQDILHLQIDASRQETARLIERDRDALSGMLRSAGYNFDGLTVQITTGDRGNGAQQFGGSGGFNPPAAQRQPEDSGSEQAWRRAGEPERIAENGRETEAPGAPVRHGGPVYL